MWLPLVVLANLISALLVVESQITGCRLAFGNARVGNAPLGATGVTGKGYGVQLLITMGLWGDAASWLLTCGRRILVNPLPRLSRRCQYAGPKETLRINVFLLAHGQRNRDVRERTIQKSDDQIRFAGHRCVHRISGQ